MPLLIIQSDNTTAKAREWLSDLMDTLLSYLDMDECAGKVNGDEVALEIVTQINYLSARSIDNVFEGAIDGLLD